MYTNTGGKAAVSLKGSILSTVKSYNVTRKTSSPHTAVTSNSKNGTLAVAGALDWSAGCVSMSVTPGMIPGEQGTFVGCQGINDDTPGTATKQSGNVICTSLATTIDVKNRAPIEWTYAFSGAGAMTESTGSLDDTTDPEVVTPTGATFSVTKASGSSVTTSSWNLSQIALTISAATSGGGATSSSAGWLKRLGGALNFTFGLTFENDSIIDIGLDVGDDVSITISLSNSQTIVVKWVHITEFGDATLDNSSAEPITLPVNGVMNAYNATADAYGEITIGGVQIWPRETAGE